MKTISYLLVDHTQAIASGDPSRLRSVKQMMSISDETLARYEFSATVIDEFINDPLLVSLLYEVVRSYRQLEALE